MEKQELYKLVQSYFQEKNRAWLHADCEKLSRYHGEQENEVCLREIVAHQELSKYRGVKTKKTNTDVSVLSSSWDSKNEQATVHVRERVQWIYRDGLEYEDEARVYEHVLYIQPYRFGEPVIHNKTVLESNTHEQATATNMETITNSESDKTDIESQYPPTASVSDGKDNENVWNSKSHRNYYDRIQAMKYAETWWDRFNPAYRKFEVDCTSFVSQCMHAGHAPMVNIGNRTRGWWYRHRGGTNDSWSYSWSVAHSLRYFLGGKGHWHAEIVEDPTQLKIGDVICYDWDGDGRWTHNTIVVAFDRLNRPLVNAHTVASRRRYWEYRDSYAWTQNTQYVFFRLPDTF